MSTNDNIEDELYSDVFYENALLSINRVINHFETTPEAFANFSVVDLKSIKLVTEGGMVQVINPNYLPVKYCHEFNKYNFKTKHIINPFAAVIANYDAHSECEICMTNEGHLKTVNFKNDMKGKSFWIVYNHDFKVDVMLRSYLNFENGIFKELNIKSKYYCESIESESYFLNLFLSGADTKLLGILPEYIIPSAYDFTSDEFSIRLKVAEMLLI